VNWAAWRVAPHPTSSPVLLLCTLPSPVNRKAKIREQSALRRSSLRNLLFIFLLTWVSRLSSWLRLTVPAAPTLDGESEGSGGDCTVRGGRGRGELRDGGFWCDVGTTA
jgi:hypothetical protein